MDARNIGYWASTGLIALAMGGGGLADLLAPPQFVEQFLALGYPVYVLPMLGVWKLLAVPAILAPGFGRLKEWAYAGMTFDLVGASVSHASVGDPATKIVIPLALLAIAFVSWALRPDGRRLAGRAEHDTPVAVPTESPRTA